MKKTYFLLIAPLIASVILLMANSSGSPGGKTGSPGDGGTTCTQCHTGTANPVSNWITTNIPVTGYVPGTNYTISVTGTHSGVVKFGFELTAENGSNSKVGTFIITDPTQTQLKNGGNAVTHTSAGNTPSGNSKTWTVDWTAPPMGTGNVTFYAAFNAANGNGGTSGDVIYTSSTMVMEEAAAPEITGITPNQANQGQNVAVTISGSGTSWTGASNVSLSFSGNPSEVIMGTDVNVTSNTQLNAEFDIPMDASVGLWDIHVDDLVKESGFSVNQIIPTLISIVPDSASQGDMLTAIITGNNTFWNGTMPGVFLSFNSNPSETIDATVTVISDIELQADFNILSDASVGLWNVNVDDLILTGAFEVHLLTGMNELSFAELEVYPNPTNGVLNLRISDEAEVSVHNISGSKMDLFRATAGSNTLDLGNYPAGIYFLNIYSNDKAERLKVIVR